MTPPRRADNFVGECDPDPSHGRAQVRKEKPRLDVAVLSTNEPDSNLPRLHRPRVVRRRGGPRPFRTQWKDISACRTDVSCVLANQRTFVWQTRLPGRRSPGAATQANWHDDGSDRSSCEYSKKLFEELLAPAHASHVASVLSETLRGNKVGRRGGVFYLRGPTPKKSFTEKGAAR
jgi:hypothetical protein